MTTDTEPPYRGIDIHADSPLGAYQITDDEVTALRAAARLTLTSS